MANPGDILLVKDRASLVAAGQGTAQFFKYVTVAPLLISLARNGGTKGLNVVNSGYCHAAVYTGTFGWAHSTNAGTITGICEPKPGDTIFRCSNGPKAKIAAAVG